MKPVLVVDISHAFWTTALGMHADRVAIPYVLKDIRQLQKDYDAVIICPDSATGTPWRRAECPEYKVKKNDQRTAEQWEALGMLIDDCRARGWHVVEPPEHPRYPGHYYEADDVIRTVALTVSASGQPVDVLSGDSDLAMLVDDEAGIRYLRRHKGGVAPMVADDIERWLGTIPSMAVEVKALAGDDDGYKPFPGIGPTGALALLNALPSGYTRSAKGVVEHTLTNGVPKNKDGKTESQAYRAIHDGGLRAVEFGYRMARPCDDVPIQLDLSRPPSPAPSRSVKAPPPQESTESRLTRLESLVRAQADRIASLESAMAGGAGFEGDYRQ